ncbi:hypothetical protein ABIA00_004299 [Bradyrhizobium ottawaense]|uniref:hypothetical protein n=1 Tax=Bradyrhizobium TaxID=374 RepID=UPI0015CF4F7C|nr:MULTISPECIES: hypothetical protein [Bradyrhizobium]MBR1364945.1 hypothetical protein [Bradyrhizobium ottawaense]
MDGHAVELWEGATKLARFANTPTLSRSINASAFAGDPDARISTTRADQAACYLFRFNNPLGIKFAMTLVLPFQEK